MTQLLPGFIDLFQGAYITTEVGKAKQPERVFPQQVIRTTDLQSVRHIINPIHISKTAFVVTADSCCAINMEEVVSETTVSSNHKLEGSKAITLMNTMSPSIPQASQRVAGQAKPGTVMRLRHVPLCWFQSITSTLHHFGVETSQEGLEASRPTLSGAQTHTLRTGQGWVLSFTIVPSKTDLHQRDEGWKKDERRL